MYTNYDYEFKDTLETTATSPQIKYMHWRLSAQGP